MIHESVLEPIIRMGGLIEDTDLVILHSGYTQNTVQGNNSRGERNLDLLLIMLASDPGDAYIHYHLGITYKQLGRSQEASYHFTKVLSMDTSRLMPATMSQVLMKLAQLDSAENRMQECILHAQASLEHDPGNLISMYLLALAYMAIGQVNQAYPFFVRIRKSSSDNLKDIEKLDTVLAYCRKVGKKQD
jgi:tetratricopeptide (TPR) repeat protein